MRARLAALAARIAAAVDLRDGFVFGGLGCVVIGLAQMHGPLAWIVGGGALFWLGIRRG